MILANDILEEFEHLVNKYEFEIDHNNNILDTYSNTTRSVVEHLYFLKCSLEYKFKASESAAEIPASHVNKTWFVITSARKPTFEIEERIICIVFKHRFFFKSRFAISICVI